MAYLPSQETQVESRLRKKEEEKLVAVAAVSNAASEAGAE